MGYSARFVADFGTLNEQDAARLAADVLAAVPTAFAGPVHGFALHNGQPTSLTLDAAAEVSGQKGLLPEHFAIAGILIASFMLPLVHLIG